MVTAQAPSGVVYDQAGNMLSNGTNQYLYDAEGRVCAVMNYSGSVTVYLYDAEGRRVSKGTANTFSCNNLASNGYTESSSYVLGLDGAQYSELSVTSNKATWLHTNVFIGGSLLATYTGSDTFFAFTDWLGTKRAELTPDGLHSVFTSLPYGNGLSSSGDAIDATEHHFTGKERDQESGNDYFGARYYASSIGRMLSPDSGVDQHPEDPQSWNLYSYVRNNPLNVVDPSGEFTCDSKTVSATQCENAHQSDDKARAALGAIKDKYGADSSQYKDALRASDALGGRKDNGVVLSIGNAGKDSDGNVTIGPMQAKTDDNPNGQNIKVTLGASNFDGSEGAALGIEHEGSHVADAHDWINTGFSPSASVNWYQSEFRAYSVQGNLATAMGITATFHDGREMMGAGAPNSQNFQGFMINSILRQSPYHLNPSSKLTLWQNHTQGGH